MSQRSTTLLTVQQRSQPTNSSVSESLATLRTHWKWAAFSQFFYTFSSLFAMEDVSLADIESDLAGGTSHVIPRIITRLLYTLTSDRKVSIDNWQFMLRRQYIKRAPDSNPFRLRPPNMLLRAATLDKMLDVGQFSVEEAEGEPGTPSSAHCSSTSEPHDWDSFSLLQKLDCMHLLTEWQFLNPLRLRTLMKDDDENASWRIEPIGYDKQKNAYWLIGSDRLWIQRALPPKTRKKRHVIEGTIARQGSPGREKRRRIEKPLESVSTTTHRAVKFKAKAKLDARPKAVVGVRSSYCHNDHSSMGFQRGKVANHPTACPIVGTRVSARLRGAQQDEWQPVPKEWMNELDERDSRLEYASHSETVIKTGLESDLEEMSELTELSEDSQAKSFEADNLTIYNAIANHRTAVKDKDLCDQPDEKPPKDFVEWETLCVSLSDWESIADRFVSGTHYSERALYKYLVHHLVPSVTEHLKDIERQRRLEEAIIYRKRSSRIALKESEREQALAAVRKHAEEEERMSRLRRIETRQQREEERRVRQENAREQRRKEREAQQRHRQAKLEETQYASPCDPGMSSFAQIQTSFSGNGDWELDCEICHRHGVNPDDNTPMMSCGSCFKWQHIACHDKATRMAGLPQRDWDSVDFICRNCRTKANISYRPMEHDRRVSQGDDDCATLGKSTSRTRGVVGIHQRLAAGRDIPHASVYNKCSTTRRHPAWFPDLMPSYSHITSTVHSQHRSQTEHAGIFQRGQDALNYFYDQESFVPSPFLPSPFHVQPESHPSFHPSESGI